MTQILVLNSSVSGDQSVSKLLVAEAVEQLIAADPKAKVVQRDLGANPIPHLTEANWLGVRGEPSTEAEQAARRLSDELLGELKAADIIVIGAPMHNFNVPTALRSWFDFVLRAGETFAYSAEGPKGLLNGKRAILALARGGFYSEGPAKGYDFQEPYLRQLLGFMGITDVDVAYGEKIGFGPDARAEAIETGRKAIAALALQALEAA